MNLFCMEHKVSDVTGREGKSGNYKLSFRIGPEEKGHLRKIKRSREIGMLNNWRIPRKTSKCYSL